MKLKDPEELVAKEERRVASVWDRLWSEEETIEQWSQPSPDVDSILSAMRFEARLGLDVGCGIGRHIPTVLRHAESVTGLDASITAVLGCSKRYGRPERPIDFTCASMFQLPFPNKQFGLVLAFNVVYHASQMGAHRALKELLRCCTADGLVLVTLLSTNNKAYRLGVQIEPNTFIREGEAGDNGVIHHFFTADEILCTVGREHIIDMIEMEPMVRGSRDPGGHHWFAVLRG
jgi:SAM-dependent methyltransferase